MKIAIYPGTFDPVTNGHLDVIKRSCLMFDKLIIGVTDDSNKKTMFSIDERINMINDAINDYPDVIQLIDSEIERCMTNFSSFEKIKKYKLIAKQFSIEKGEIIATVLTSWSKLSFANSL